MVRIFISHSSKDKWLIDPIVANLKLISVAEKGVRVSTVVEYITVYVNFDPLDSKTLDEMIQKVTSNAVFIKENSAKTKAALAMVLLLFCGFLLLASGGSK
ncbi:MAG: hypothetical protein ACBZ72_01200 [Candidatus Bathyarchaeia archaeon]|jgi:hypothetical protein